MLASNPARPAQANFPKLQDILVNLSVKDSPKVTRRLKLIGDPYMFHEFTDKVYVPNPDNDPELKGKTMRVPFPDADVNKSFNRIGHDDPDQCPWRKQGYVFTTQYAQNVLERQEDGTWQVKILKKGKAIFSEIAKKIQGNYEDEEWEGEDDARHYGSRVSPCVKITAKATGKQPPLSVEYDVYFESKNVVVDEDMVELLRKAGEPSAEDLEQERKSYNTARKSDRYMPEWNDFFAYGYPLHRIFKHTPVKGDALPSLAPQAKDSYVVKPAKKVVDPVVDDEEDVLYVAKTPTKASGPIIVDDEDEVFPTPKPKVAKAAPKPVVVEDEDDDDEDSIGWLND